MALAIGFQNVLRDFNIEGYAKNARYDRLSDGRRALKLENGVWVYEDVYGGSNPYAGSIFVMRNQAPYWFVGYQGICKSKSFTSESLYEELRDALSSPDPNFPVRGKNGFMTRSGFLYGMSGDGDLSYFKNGQEWLEKDGVKHYTGEFNGLHIGE